MIVGDRKALKATLTHGISNILRQLVELYSSNLNHLGVQTSVIAGLSFAGAIASYFPDHKSDLTRISILSGLYYTLIQLSLICTLLSMVICTISGAYGPSLALTGKSSRVIVYAVKEMQRMQEYVFALGGFSILCMLLALIVYSYAEYDLQHAILVTIFTVLGGALIFRRGVNTLQEIRYKGTKYLDEILRAFQGGDGFVVDGVGSKTSKKIANPTITFASDVWRKREMHKGGKFEYNYAVLNNGSIDFYKSKSSFDDGENRLSALRLRYMRLSTDPKDFSAQSTSLLPSFGGKVYERDRSLIFVLLPLDDHEVVNSANIVELQAISGQSFKTWISNLRQVEDFYAAVNGNALTAVLENA